MPPSSYGSSRNLSCEEDYLPLSLEDKPKEKYPSLQRILLTPGRNASRTPYLPITNNRFMPGIEIEVLLDFMIPVLRSEKAGTADK